MTNQQRQKILDQYAKRIKELTEELNHYLEEYQRLIREQDST